MNSTPEDLLKLMAHPVRLTILRRLRQGESCVDRLIQLLGVPQPNVSQHLRRLLDSKLVRVEQKGRKRCYSLNDERVVEILSIIDGEVITENTTKSRRHK